MQRTRARAGARLLAPMAALALLIAAAAVPPDGPGYRHYVVGNPADVTRPTRGLLVRQGGGDAVDANYVGMGERAGGGDFVVLRASGDDEYNAYIHELCRCDSVATLIVDNRAAASNPFVVETVRHAEALFIAG